MCKTYGYNSQRTHWADVAQEASGSHSQSPVMIAEPQHHSPQLWWKYIISNHTCQGGPLEREIHSPITVQYFHKFSSSLNGEEFVYYLQIAATLQNVIMSQFTRDFILRKTMFRHQQQ